MSAMKTFEIILTEHRNLDEALDELAREFGDGMRDENMAEYIRDNHAEIHGR